MWWYVVGYTISCILIVPSVVLLLLPPVGIVAVIASCLPAWYPHAKRVAWDLRDQPYVPEDEDGSYIPKPWE